MPQPLNLVVELLTELSGGVVAKQAQLLQIYALTLNVHGKGFRDGESRC